MQAQYEAGTLNIAEVARYFYLQAPIHRLTQGFNQGRLKAEFALSLGQLLGGEPLLEAMRVEEVLNTIGLGDPARAVELYDEWVARKKSFPPQLKELIERSRTDQSQQMAAAVVAYPDLAMQDVSELPAELAGKK